MIIIEGNRLLKKWVWLTWFEKDDGFHTGKLGWVDIEPLVACIHLREVVNKRDGLWWNHLLKPVLCVNCKKGVWSYIFFSYQPRHMNRILTDLPRRKERAFQTVGTTELRTIRKAQTNSPLIESPENIIRSASSLHNTSTWKLQQLQLPNTVVSRFSVSLVDCRDLVD